MDCEGEQDYCFNMKKELTDEEKILLEKQNARLIPEFKANKLEEEAKKHWDIFYKRNETRFFRDRHWTTREFEDLVGCGEGRRKLLEVGCGVGNFIFPLKREGLGFHYYVCDLSPRAIEFVRRNIDYDPVCMEAFQADITEDSLKGKIQSEVDIATLVFVLSTIHPKKFNSVVKNLWDVLGPGGILLFRDYGLYDMAQLRFKPGHKISDNFYMRQDGTRSYFFSTELVKSLFRDAGFIEISCCYVHRRTVNKKEGIDVPRIFVQAKFQKPR